MSDQVQADFVAAVHLRPDGSARAGPVNPTINAEMAELRVSLRKAGFKDEHSTQSICKRVLLFRATDRDSIVALDATKQKWRQRCELQKCLGGFVFFPWVCATVSPGNTPCLYLYCEVWGNGRHGHDRVSVDGRFACAPDGGGRRPAPRGGISPPRSAFR